MSNSSNQRQWRNFLIRPAIQLRITATNLVFLYIVAAWLIVTLLMPIYESVQDPSDLLAQHFSAKFFLILLERTAWLLGCVAILGLVHQVVITHRFCGPMVNFCHTWQRVKQGDLTRRVHLRQRDFFQQEADEINAMILALDRRLLSVVGHHQRSLALIRQIRTTTAQGKLPSIEALSELHYSASATQAELAGFTLSESTGPFEAEYPDPAAST